MDMDKAFNNAKWFAVGLLVLVVILFILAIGAKAATGLVLAVYIGMIVALIGTIFGCSKQTMIGPICGIIVSILFIVFGGLIEKIFGVLYLIDCIKLINGLNK